MKSRILIVDDEKDMRELLRSFIENDKYEIVEASNGKEAFNLVSSEPFDLYVTDVFMPEMNGVEFLKILKMLDPDAVVIIVTGYDNMECTRQALDYGAFRFLVKPVKMVEFKSIVEMGILERKKLSVTSTSDKLLRMKEKVTSNIELHEMLLERFQAFLSNVEKKNPTYVEIGGPGTKGKIWARFFSAFKPIQLEMSFNQEEINIMILSILSNSQLETLINQKFVRSNYGFTKDGVEYRYRMNIYFEMDELVIGIKTTRRILINFESMRFPAPVLNKLTYKNENSGIIIVSGPPGSGKSSLVDAVVNLNNSYLSGSIFIISDSIEYYHESKNSVVRHQELHRDVNSIPEALEKSLNCKPNMVVIEDISSPEILDAMIKLSDTGCLVIATLRNKSVVEVFYKLISFYDISQHSLIKKQLARSIISVICLQLLPSSQGKVVPVKETYVMNEQTSSIIASGNIDELHEVIQRSKKCGMHTFEQDLVHSIRAGLITTEIAIEFANNPHLLKNMLQYS